MMKWIKAWLRTRRALKVLEKQIGALRIKLGIESQWDIEQLSRGSGINRLDYGTGDFPPQAERLMSLCKLYLLTKLLGSDEALLYKLTDV